MLPAPIFVDLVEEDDYDADMVAEAAPLASTADPAVSAVAAAAVPQQTTAPAAVAVTATPVMGNGAAVQQLPTNLPAPALGAQPAAPVQVQHSFGITRRC